MAYSNPAIPRGTIRGSGDGNGVIEGNTDNGCPGNTNNGVLEVTGETVTFWNDLTIAQLIDLNSTAASETIYNYANGGIIADMFPAAIIGNGNYIYVYSGGVNGGDGQNYFGLSQVLALGCFEIGSGVSLSVSQAYHIDTKIDDGYPQTGNVTAVYLNTNNLNGGSLIGNNTNNLAPVWAGASDTSATAASPSTCYDNGGNGGTQQYSLTQNLGTGLNCALSFKFQ